MFNTALRTSHTPSKRPVRLRQRRKVESAPGRRVSAGVYSLRQCSFSTLWGLWHTVHTLRTTVLMYSTRMYTCIALGERCWGGHGTLQGATPSQIAGRRGSCRRRRRQGLACLGVDAPRLPVRLAVRSVDLLARLCHGQGQGQWSGSGPGSVSASGEGSSQLLPLARHERGSCHCHHHRYPPLRRACILWVAMSVARLVTLFFSKVALSLAGSKLSLT